MVGDKTHKSVTLYIQDLSILTIGIANGFDMEIAK